MEECSHHQYQLVCVAIDKFNGDLITNIFVTLCDEVHWSDFVFISFGCRLGGPCQSGNSYISLIEFFLNYFDHLCFHFLGSLFLRNAVT